MYTLSFLATTPPKTTPTDVPLIQNIVAFAAGIVGGLIALFMIFAIFMEAKNLIKGEGSASIWKLLGKVLVFILMIGLVYVAIGYTSLGQSAKDVADKGVGAVISTVSDALK